MLQNQRNQFTTFHSLTRSALSKNNLPRTLLQIRSRQRFSVNYKVIPIQIENLLLKNRKQLFKGKSMNIELTGQKRIMRQRSNKNKGSETTQKVIQNIPPGTKRTITLLKKIMERIVLNSIK